MTYAEIRKECDKFGAITQDPSGIDTCVFSGFRCSGKSCVSKAYWSKSHRQPGWYKARALERTELQAQYEEEILNV